MTLSNFDWTDKNSVKWFILLPTGHEGPYSLNQLTQLHEKKRLSASSKIWCEGLGHPVTVLEAMVGQPQQEKHEEDALPPLPQEDEIPPVPLESLKEEVEVSDVPELPKESKSKFPIWLLMPLFVAAILVLIFVSVAEENAKVEIRRYPKMSQNLHERILKENAFEGWNKPIFFKEYLPEDQSQIWLVTSSFHRCEVEGIFHSVKGKLLSPKDESVAFKTTGQLKNHVVDFSHFNFSSGTRIIPGLYEVDIKATHCSWDGFLPLLMNKFIRPDEEYLARTKVVLFSKGPQEFSAILDKLLKKKMEIELKEQNLNEIFWQDLQQKFETLEAITLQIEQHFLDYTGEGPDLFLKALPKMVDQYTRKFGSFLTSFVVENENYFKSLNSSEKGGSKKRNYELMVRLSAKRIGLESMKFIEEFQGMKKKPSKSDLAKIEGRIKKAFSVLKHDLNERTQQVSSDRSR